FAVVAALFFSHSLHDALPISPGVVVGVVVQMHLAQDDLSLVGDGATVEGAVAVAQRQPAQVQGRARKDLQDAIVARAVDDRLVRDRKSTRLNSSHVKISYAVF